MPQMPWAQALSPIAQTAMQHLQEQRSRQQNISEGSILNKVIGNVLQQKGENASALDFMGALTQAQQQGVSPQNVNAYLEATPKFMQEQTRSTQLNPAMVAAQAEQRKAATGERQYAYEVNKKYIENLEQHATKINDLE